ncbi:MAG: sigma-70 family RNA polymerase sigma factor [Actinobacteria bacterium]|nr:sigma-70 family RNA polymerase sigma factor [Actinomycetota bacterium]
MATTPRPNWTTLTDEQFTAAALYDDRDWLGELLSRYQERLWRCAHRMVSPGESEDAIQEINERILRGIPRFRGDSTIGTWIFAVARNTCLDVRRRRKPPTCSSDAIPEDIPGASRPADAFDISILGCRTALAIHELPKGQAGVVVLRLGWGFSTAETATRLGISEDAVKARLRRARRQLQSALAQQIACPRCGPGTYAVTGSTVV